MGVWYAGAMATSLEEVSFFASVETIKQAILRLDPQIAGLDAAVQACTNLDATVRQQWDAFVKGYADFTEDYRDPNFWQQLFSGFNFSLFDISARLEAYERDVLTWTDALAKRCANVPPKPSEPGGEGLSTGTKWLIGGGIAVVGLLAIAPLIRELAAGISTARRVRTP